MDNIYNYCPAMMADGGRQFTDYKTATRRNEYIKYINGITRDDQYRVFLQQNGTQIQNNMWDYHKTYSSCRTTSCIHNAPTRDSPQDFAKQREAFENQFKKNTKKGKNCSKEADFRLN